MSDTSKTTVDSLASKRRKLLHQGLMLEYFTLGWNVIGVAIVMFAALKSDSVALAGFGLDSLIEIGASMVVIWELTGVGLNRRKIALRLIASAFFVLAVYILVQSFRSFSLYRVADTSPLGIAWLIITFAAMVALAQGKRVIGSKLDNPVLITEGRVTMIDAYLAAAVLLGLLMNALLGWWWADPVAGLVIVYYGIKEAFHAWAESRLLPAR